MTSIRILGWDHPRCVDPLREAARVWNEADPHSVVTVSARPLSEFNDQPLEELSSNCDLMVIDHPHLATAAHAGAIAPLEDLVDTTVIDQIRNDALGASWDCYSLDSHIWALPADTACQVAASRPDQFEALDEQLPRSWGQVLNLAERRPGFVALPLYPTDAISSLLSIAAGLGANFSDDGDALTSDANREAMLVALSMLGHLTDIVWQGSWDSNPPALLDRMAGGDEIGYIPLTYSYSQYASPAALNPLQFHVPVSPVGSLLGGAGLAVSSQAVAPEAAANFASWFCSPGVQSAIVGLNGGQPAMRSAWEDAQCDERVGGMLTATKQAHEAAVVRPHSLWWPGFQEDAGNLLAFALRTGTSPYVIFDRLERCHEAHATAESTATNGVHSARR
ncbi:MULTISPECIES: extracellular solute-binding protein [unclassified Rhodococcus (in: high G+C Gram-positive bacteria)]|uniref:extracellular solute-binding protein n=1 Tax=unclassified Rhodococcus (in: high G+C Gram-positive bacteria) TaxID=192944 RepID=UPI0005E25248|nr:MULTISPECIES: extracellular solute-binding protein [unclassified Rhodococcus (in: high G+C Gram-positive bacteria)]KJF19314.1 Maltose-binding periplasmic protein [Rhodococcus sp. AD45]RZL21779.1 MAG: extracellular solute-binding protein [Rhodococcus sp. (in: high G+C Gram-positive bacteria)]